MVRDIRFEIHTIGLAVDEATRAQLQYIAQATGGTCRDADSPEEFDLALEEAADAAAEAVGGDVVDLRTPTMVAISPDGQHVYVTGGDSVAVFSPDPATEALTFVEVIRNAEK